MKLLLAFLVLSLIAGCSAQSLAVNCTQAVGYCGTSVFNAGVDGVAETGPNYGCLGTQDLGAPSWFFFQVNAGNNLTIDFANSEELDIDYAIWGPFVTDDNCDLLRTGSLAPVSCSASFSDTEEAVINVNPNEYYVMVVTNPTRNDTLISVVVRAQAVNGSATNGNLNCRLGSPTPSTSLSNSMSASTSFSNSISNSFSPSISDTNTATASISISNSGAASQSTSPTRTPTPSTSPTRSDSSSVTATRTPTPSTSPTRSDSSSASPTRSFTSSPSGTRSTTPTPTGSRSSTRSRTPSGTPRRSRSNTPTQTPTPSETRSNRPTRTPTRTPTISRSTTRTPTASQSFNFTVIPRTTGLRTTGVVARTTGVVARTTGVVARTTGIAPSASNSPVARTTGVVVARTTGVVARTTGIRPSDSPSASFESSAAFSASPFLSMTFVVLALVFTILNIAY